jgi:hypothetical protein
MDGEWAPHVAPKDATTGSDGRGRRVLTDARVLDVPGEAASLMDEPEWTNGDRNARTLVATDRLRVTLVALREARALGAETTDDALVVQVLRGAVELRLAGREPQRIAAGQLECVEQPEGWSLVARTDCLLLLTVALASAHATAKSRRDRSRPPAGPTGR